MPTVVFIEVVWNDYVFLHCWQLTFQAAAACCYMYCYVNFSLKVSHGLSLSKYTESLDNLGNEYQVNSAGHKLTTIVFCYS